MKERTSYPVWPIMKAYITDFLSLSLNKSERDVALRALGHMRSRDVTKLAEIGDLQACSVSSSLEARFRLQVSAFVKKNESLEIKEVTEDAAIRAFYRSERRCLIVNKRLTHYHLHPSRLDFELQGYVEEMRSFIKNVLGDVRKFIDGIPSRLSVTSGATATTSRKESIPFMKLMRRIPCGTRAVPYIQALSSFWGYGKVGMAKVSYNRVTFVPKSFKTRRTIACEPVANSALQLCVDSYLKDRLRLYGIDLRSQARNQSLAVRGSIDGSFSTVDLESASDSVALDLIHYLFPDEWSKVLIDFRSPFGEVSGGDDAIDHICYSKFASMGNGSTFVVETLVFAAACFAVGSSDHAVYGDDIAIRDVYVEPLVKTLAYLGFRVNQQKTFTSAAEIPFRESCGVNCWAGEDITPFYFRSDARSKPDLCHLANGLIKIALCEGLLLENVIRIIHSEALPLGPPSDNSRACVWIDMHTCYKLRLLKWHKGLQLLTFKGFRPYLRNQDYLCDPKDSRSMFLWFLRANQVSIGSDPWSSSERYARRDYKYKRGECQVVIPAVGASPYLYWWGEYYLAHKAR